MPEAVVVHVIGTVVLLSVALLTVASVTIVQQINYVQTLNVMLSEAAESCARQIVELVSIHTIGGGEYTYMSLTLPQSLGGQPYNLTLENLGENMLMVVAQLQMYKQVRIVVTPNFGQAPVYAVSSTAEFGDLTLSPTILLPTPQGWKASLVAIRVGEAIIVGFTNQPPARVVEGRPPSCRFLDWSRDVIGLAGSTIRLNYTIFNPGDVPSWMTIEVVDNIGRKLNEKTVYVEDGAVAVGSIPVQLNVPGGIYAWNLACRVDIEEPTLVGVVVEVLAPRIEVLDVTNPLIGEASSIAQLSVTLRNVGRVKGTVSILLDEEILSEVVLMPGEIQRLLLGVRLPSTIGSYGANLKVLVKETGETRVIPIGITVIGSDPYIASLNSSVVGLPGWRPKLYVGIANPSNVPTEVEVLVDGSVLDRFIVPAKGSIVAIVRPTMPAGRGFYVWQVSLRKEGTIVSSSRVLVEVRDFREVKRNAVFIGVGPYTLKDDDKLCGREQTGNKKRCVTTLTLADGLADQFYYGVGIAVRVYLPTSGNAYRGIGLLGKDRLYEVSTYVKGGNAQLSTRLLDTANGQWSTPEISRSEKLPTAGYYSLHAYAVCDGASCRLDSYLYSTSLLLFLQSNVRGSVPSSLALLVDEGTGAFTNLVVTKGDSRFVTLQGLPPGWTVELWEGSELVARSSDGRLLVASRYMMNSARLRFIDPYNEPLPVDRVIGSLIGGDIVVYSSES